MMKFILQDLLILLLVIVLFIVGLVIFSVYWITVLCYVTFANLVTRTREWIRI
jgi:hypothetical protein